MFRLTLLAATIALAACSRGEPAPAEASAPAAVPAAGATGATANTATPVAAAATGVRAGDIVISNAWTRATAPNAPVAGGFMTLRNTGTQADRLVSLRSDAAAEVQVHEMRHDGGVMRMRRLADGLEIAPNATVSLAPGGYHLMLMQPARPFVEGETVDVTATFERAGEVTLPLQVRALGAGADPHAHP